MSSGTAEENEYFAIRIVPMIMFSTIFLTASFMGVLAFLSGEAAGVNERLPWYLVIWAMMFVGSIVLLERAGSNGRTIIVTTLVVSIVLFVLTVLGIEGVLFTMEKPKVVINSELILYLLSASLVGVGLAYWGINHWREFTPGPDRL